MLFRKALASFLIITAMGAPYALAADPLKIGLAAPLSGPFKRIGDQILAGAALASSTLLIEILPQDDLCTAESGEALAQAFVTNKVSSATGFTCLESLNAALPILTRANISVLSTSIRADALTDTKPKTDFKFYRIAPREDMEAAAIAKFLLPRWRDKNFAIIDDGTVHARDLAESFRFAATEANLKPVFTDTFRPGLENQAALARRLQKSGATHVFMGGDIEDVMVLSANSVATGALEIATGETVNPAEDNKERGTVLALAIPDQSLKPEAAKAVHALRLQGIEPDNYALTMYAAIEIIAQAAASPNGMNTLGTGNYATVIGQIEFDDKGDLAQNPFVLVELKSQQFRVLYGQTSQ